MKTGYKVCDAMTTKPIMVSFGTSIKECASIMGSRHVGALLVGKGDKLEGIMTEQDIVRKLVANNLNPLKKTAKDVMEEKIKTISPEKDIYEALMLMRDLNIRHLPVMDGTKMIGLLTLKDVLKIEPQLFDLLVEKFELREESRKPIYHIGEKEGICAMCGNYAEKLYVVSGAKVCLNCKKG